MKQNRELQEIYRSLSVLRKKIQESHDFLRKEILIFLRLFPFDFSEKPFNLCLFTFQSVKFRRFSNF